MEVENIVAEIKDVLKTTESEHNPFEGFTDLITYTSQINIQEVYPNLFMGNKAAVESLDCLKANKITHIVNCAEGNSSDSIGIEASYYKDTSFKYMGLQIRDIKDFDASSIFESSSEFIHDALENNGVVMVNCYVGMSRSSCAVCAYLILKKNHSAVAAFKYLKGKRNIMPNESFIEQLVKLDLKYKKG